MCTRTWDKPTYLLNGEFVEDGRWRGRRPENNQWVYGRLLKTKDGKIKGILNENTRRVYRPDMENPAFCNGFVCGIPVFDSSDITEPVVWYVELARVIEPTVESYDPLKPTDYEIALTFDEIKQKYDTFEKSFKLYNSYAESYTFLYEYGNEQLATALSQLDVLAVEKDKLCEEIQIPLNSHDVTVRSLLELSSTRLKKYKAISSLLGNTRSYVGMDYKRKYVFDDLKFRTKHFTVALTLDGIADHYVYMTTDNEWVDIWVGNDFGVKCFIIESRLFSMHIDLRYHSFTDSFLQTYIASVTNILKSYNEL